MTDQEKDELWPVDLTFDQMFAICWRVKKWRLNGSVAFSETRGTDSASSAADLDETEVCALYDTESESGIEATRERNLVSRVFNDTYRALVNSGFGFRPNEIAVSNWATSANFGVGSWSGSTPSSPPSPPALSFSMLGNYVLYDPETHLFSPPFNGLGPLIPQEFAGNPLFGSADFDRNPETVSGGAILLKTPGTLTVTTGITSSFQVPIQISWRFDGGGTGTSGSGSGDFTLEAAEYWPYENSTHSPVWDSVSGGPLVDPFS